MHVFYFCYEAGLGETFLFPHPINYDGFDLAPNDCVWLIPGTYCGS